MFFSSQFLNMFSPSSDINPCHSLFLIGITCGPIWGSFPVRDHLRFNLGIICGPGSFAVLGSFADPYSSVADNQQGRQAMSIFSGTVIHGGHFNISISSLNQSPTLDTPETEIKSTKRYKRPKVLDSDSK